MHWMVLHYVITEDWVSESLMLLANPEAIADGKYMYVYFE